MPTLARFGKLLIQMYPGDHAPPHFHVVTPEQEALVTLANLEIYAGQIDRQSLKIAVEWAAANMDHLNSEWSRLNER